MLRECSTCSLCYSSVVPTMGGSPPHHAKLVHIHIKFNPYIYYSYITYCIYYSLIRLNPFITIVISHLHLLSSPTSSSSPASSWCPRPPPHRAAPRRGPRGAAARPSKRSAAGSCAAAPPASSEMRVDVDIKGTARHTHILIYHIYYSI